VSGPYGCYHPLVVAGLLVVSAFFSASETSIFSLESHRVAAMGSDGTGSGGTLARLREGPNRLLITVLVGSNVVNVAIASVTTAALVGQFGPERGPLVATVNDALDLRLPDDGDASVADLLARELGESLDAGDSVAIGDARLTVRSLSDDGRVQQGLVERSETK